MAYSANSSCSNYALVSLSPVIIGTIKLTFFLCIESFSHKNLMSDHPTFHILSLSFFYLTSRLPPVLFTLMALLLLLLRCVSSTYSIWAICSFVRFFLNWIKAKIDGETLWGRYVVNVFHFYVYATIQQPNEWTNQQVKHAITKWLRNYGLGHVVSATFFDMYMQHNQ